MWSCSSRSPGALHVAFIGIVWALAVRRRGGSWSALGLRPWSGGGPLWTIPAAVLAMLAIVVAYGAVIHALGWSDDLQLEIFDDRRIGVVAAAGALAIIAAPFVEEVFFRGFILQGLARHMTPVKAALLSSALFALAHVRPITYAPIFLIGLVLAFVFLRTRLAAPGDGRPRRLQRRRRRGNLVVRFRSLDGTPMSRIADGFAKAKAEGRPALIAYVTVGYPEAGATEALAAAILDGGADMLEIGVPFSDPLAEGTTIQRSSQIALEHGVTLDICIGTCGALRKRYPVVPLMLMGYYNPVLSYGLDRFAERAAGAGIDGVIVVDLPAEEAAPLLQVCRPRGIDVILLLAPTSTDERIRKASEVASGFVYCVSLAGVTGSRERLADGLAGFMERVRKFVDLPLAVGFGISTAEHVRAVGELADGAIVGSAVINAITEGGAEGVRALIADLSGPEQRS